MALSKYCQITLFNEFVGVISVSIVIQHGKPTASEKDGLSKEQRLARDAKVSACMALHVRNRITRKFIRPIRLPVLRLIKTMMKEISFLNQSCANYGCL